MLNIQNWYTDIEQGGQKIQTGEKGEETEKSWRGIEELEVENKRESVKAKISNSIFWTLNNSSIKTSYKLKQHRYLKGGSLFPSHKPNSPFPRSKAETLKLKSQVLIIGVPLGT